MRTARLWILATLSAMALASLAGCSSAPPPAKKDTNPSDPSKSSHTEDSNDGNGNSNSQSSDLTSTPRQTSLVAEGGSCGGSSRLQCMSGLLCNLNGSTDPNANGICQRNSGADLGASCGGPTRTTCMSGLVCQRNSTDPNDTGTCERNTPGNEGDSCGGTARLVCQVGLTCTRDASNPNSTGVCSRPEAQTHFCAQVGRCCDSLPDGFQKAACVGMIIANDEDVCAGGLIYCSTGGIDFGLGDIFGGGGGF